LSIGRMRIFIGT